MTFSKTFKPKVNFLLKRIGKKIVIAPKKWSGLHDNDKIDIVPNNWIKL
jgi:hypothetical protein